MAIVRPDDDAYWEAYVRGLNPQTACELLGIKHFPDQLASAANLLLLAQHLKAKHPKMTIRQALVAELKAGPYPPSGSEDTDYWQAIKPHLPVLREVVKHHLKACGHLNE